MPKTYTRKKTNVKCPGLMQVAEVLQKAENCAAILFVSLPFHFLLLQEMCFVKSLFVLRMNVEGMKSKFSPQNSGKPGRTCHTVPAKFYPSPVVF